MKNIETIWTDDKRIIKCHEDSRTVIVTQDRYIDPCMIIDIDETTDAFNQMDFGEFVDMLKECLEDCDIEVIE